MTPPKIVDGMAVFTLATGEKVRVGLMEGGLGVVGYRLNIHTDQTLFTFPIASNSIAILTPRSLAAESAEQKRIVHERDSNKP